MTTMVALSRLRSGHEYPGADINCRVMGRADEIDQLAASIKAEFLLQPLLVCKAPDGDDGFFVIDGNRRLSALQKLLNDGVFEANIDVPVLVWHEDISPIDALRKSLVANDTRLPLHPVDRHAAFAKCHESGDSIADIATRYAVDQRVVKQALALGRLAPVIRSAWRAGDIDAEEAQAFTVVEDHEVQAKAFNKLKKSRELTRWGIRRHLLGEQHDVDSALAFVGRTAFEAAGGAVVEDLFVDEDNSSAVTDPDLLKKLAAEKLKQKCDQLLADGWSWAELKSDLPDMARHSWQRLPGVTAKKASAAQKEKSGCIVTIDHNGKLDIAYGVIKPGSKAATEAKKKDKAKRVAKGEMPKDISQALAQDLVEQRTRAAAAAIVSDPDVALAVLLAGFMAGGRGGVCVTSRGLINNSTEPEEFTDALKLALKMTRDVKVKMLAVIAAESLDFRNGDAESRAAICDAIPAAAMDEALQKTFAAGDYFERAPKETVLQAITEALGKDAAKPLADKKKPEVAAFAAKELPTKGWLPPELRTAHYKLVTGKAAGVTKVPAKKKGNGKKQ